MHSQRVVEQDRQYLRAVGVVTPPRVVSPRRAPRLRYSDPARRQGTSPNVRVTHADGSEEYRSASSFRQRITRTTATRTARRVKYDRVRHLTSADLAPVQNYEED